MPPSISIPPKSQRATQPFNLDHSPSSSNSVFDNGDLDEEEILQLSSSDSSTGPSPVIPKLTLQTDGDGVDEISKDLAELERLRRSVQKNLRLRPIKSKSRLPKIDADELGMRMPGAFPLSATMKGFELESPIIDSPLQAPAPGPSTSAAPHSITATGGMTEDGRWDDGVGMHVGNDVATMGNSTASSTATSASTTPTKKVKGTAKTKVPPALILASHFSRDIHHITSKHGEDETASGMRDEFVPRSRISPPQSASLVVRTNSPLSATSPTSSILSSYFTPVGDTPVTSQFGGAGFGSFGDLSLGSAGHEVPLETSSDTLTSAVTVSTPTEIAASTVGAASTSMTPDQKPNRPQPIPAKDLYTRLSDVLSDADTKTRPLLIDTRAPAAHVAYRIRGSMNIAIPSLILKRCRKVTASGVLRGEGSGPGSGRPAAGVKGGFQNLEALRQFVVGETMKDEWDAMLKSRTQEVQVDVVWDGDIIVYDEEMEQDVAGTAWTLMEVLMPLVSVHGGRVDYLEGGIMKGVKDTELEKLIEFGPIMGVVEEDAPVTVGAKKSATGGLFQLDTHKKSPEIEISSSMSSASASTTHSSNPASPVPLSIPRSPLSIIPPSLASSNASNNASISNTNNANMKFDDNSTTYLLPEIPGAPSVLDSTPSPPPSYLTFRHNKSPHLGNATIGGLKAKRPSVPNLRRIDTTSTERLGPNVPKLSVKTKPVRSATLTIPPRLTLPGSSGSGLQPPTSPSHLNLVYSSHSPPGSARPNGGFGEGGAIGGNGNIGLTPYFTPPHTPGTPKAFSALQNSYGGPTSAHPNSQGGSYSSFFGSPEPSSSAHYQYPPSPSTARPDPPTTESEAIPTFTISTILPNFLYLGPELTEPGHVEELRELGVKRILNIAAECNENDHGLGLKNRFDRYVKIPMRDTVEEENVMTGVKEVCEILDDARLHSAPTYVHCKAGKSRSVTAVMAYLIHANHWTLSRAYAFVLERRKGISPNIGFVSELMNFEEQELGGKSIGVQSGDNGEGGPGTGEEVAFVGMGMGLRRGGHIRESLPPMESYSSSSVGVGGEGSSGPGLGPMSAGGIGLQRVLVGDQAQEMEVKDASGRYRHARRAPVDENTLQPLRRVSKAGLESSVFEEVPRGEREKEKGEGVNGVKTV